MEDIKSLLTVPYNEDNYRKFSNEFLKDVDTMPIVEQKPPLSFKDTIDSYRVFGTYKDSNGKEIVILSIKVKNNSSARQAQRNFVAYLLENDFVKFSAALAAYYDDVRNNWKLSFVTVQYELNEKGVELKFKPARRFSFLVGKDEPTKTYTQQLNPIFISNEKPLLEDISEAFSVSRLSKEFYQDYRNKYYELFDHLKDNREFRIESSQLGYKPDKFATTFCKKTLGQIVFLHFIQKKGWLGVHKNWGDGDKQYLYTNAKAFKGCNFFNDFLEPLFYNALNSKRDNDMYLGEKVPFLNGGLFHPIENYDWENTDFKIPNSFWMNNEETGFLDILSQYNFTVDEADPNEEEMAIDPEMLGKIFESLLDTNDRSQLGAFYTPREIVHYMCEESLALKISKTLGLDYESILNFIRYGDALKETEFIKEFAEDIDKELSSFTICDPAVGSGAFLVGMLNEIVKLKFNLSKYTNKELNKYDTKLQIIQNCLYGVDVEFDAVEIAKLRLWLSLIVDEKVIADESPRPLPNLNFHLRVGNSLVDTFDGIKLWNIRWRGSKKEAKQDMQINLFNVDTVNSILSRLKESKNKFFNASNDNEKQELLNQIEKEQLELIRAELIAKGKYKVFDSIEEMIKKKTKPFFIWELEFEEVFEKGGFDLVIANPPYVQLQKDGGKLADQLKDQGYETFNRMGDIYCIFYEKGIHLLKESGILCYITSNKWMRAGYGENLRGFLANNTNPIKLIDFGGNKVFESATVDVSILIAAKENNDGKTIAVTIDNDCMNNMSDYINQHNTVNSFVNSENWTLLNNIEMSIKKKIECIGTRLSEWELNINRGILTGYNDAFIIDEETKNRLISKEPKSAEIIRPILRGKDIKKYTYQFANLWLIYIPWHFPLQSDNTITGSSSIAEKHFQNDYPVLYEYMKSYRKELSSRNKAETGIRYEWYALQRWGSNYWNEFNKQKIIYPCIMSQESSFMYDRQGVYYTIAPGNIITGKDLIYLLAFLNSKIYYFALRKYYMGGGIEGELKTNRLLILPVPLKESIDNKISNSIEHYCEELLDEYESNKTINAKQLNSIEMLISKVLDLSEEEQDFILNYKF